MSGVSVLDPTVLDALRGDGDELLGDLIDIFLADAPQRLERIREALGRADWAALDVNAHSLKGSSASLGAVHMAALCGRLERFAGSGDRADAGLVLRELEEQFALVHEALERERGAR